MTKDRPRASLAVEMDLPWLERHRELIQAIARSYGLEPAVVAGLMSRESGGGRLLGKWGNPPETGDNGHARGLMQIDDRWHQAFISIGDFWQYPAGNIAYGCYLIKQNLIALAKQFPSLSDHDRLQAAIAAYNCGLSRAVRAINQEKDLDTWTTGGDFSRDVMERAGMLRARGWVRYCLF